MALEARHRAPDAAREHQRPAHRNRKRPLGRTELKPLTHWKDGRPGTEFNFKFYRQATNKIVGISEQAEAFLSRFF